MSIEKQVSFKVTNTYSTLNSFSPETKNVWIIFHGMGYLSRYFLKYFSSLSSEHNYFIAPQAPSKYYLGEQFKHVGASWLTRENTQEEIENVLNYVDTVYEAEHIPANCKLIVLGYSQGVSIAMRWMVRRKQQCSQLVLLSGGIPIELKASDFLYLNENTQVTYLYGDKDEYITETRKTEELLKAKQLFGDRLHSEVFIGKHEVHIPFLQKLAENFK